MGHIGFSIRGSRHAPLIDERVFALKGSITLAQNPVIDFDYRVNGAETMQVLVTDSDGASWQKSFPIGQGS